MNPVPQEMDFFAAAQCLPLTVDKTLYMLQEKLYQLIEEEVSGCKNQPLYVAVQQEKRGNTV